LRVRNRYVDLLRALAIIRVVVYHTLGYAWLTVVFPAMGLMFALGGSLMAASIDRVGVRAIGRRMRRILPPVWLLATTAIVAMHLTGGIDAGWKILLWVLPLADPPATPATAQWLAMIWYVRSYLWFIVASPVMLWAFRRWPVPSVVLPFAGLVVAVVTESGLRGVPRDFLLYAPMWLLGFAHHDGKLRELSGKILWPLIGVLGAAGLILLYRAPGPRGYDLNDAPIADALWSVAFLLALLRFAPQLRRLPSAVEAINHRAMTVYLWHQAAIVLVGAAAAGFGVALLGPTGALIELGSVFALLAIAVLGLGWVEDLAARRRPVLVPTPRIRIPEPAPPSIAAEAPMLVRT
jgi:peptidoglycan/LPS O-acetylase OafA/YrhL